jgi:Zn-dependent protease
LNDPENCDGLTAVIEFREKSNLMLGSLVNPLSCGHVEPVDWRVRRRMNQRGNPLFLSFSVGNWYGVNLRISYLMPIMLVWFLYEFRLQLGFALFVVMFVSVLFHEIGHVLAASATDGSGDEILMWPFGGLAFVETTSPRSQRLTAAAGPFVNLMLCGLFLPAVLVSDTLPRVLNPLEVPFTPDEFGRKLMSDLQVLTFWFNWVCLLINLIPAYPLDGGQILRSWLNGRMGAGLGTEIAITIGMGAAATMILVDLIFFKHVVLIVIGFTIILLAMNEKYQLQAGENFDDSFMGYDFSQGYTSLEKSETPKPEPKLSLWQRWKQRRLALKLRKQAEQEQATEQQLDAILAKVHERGLSSLTAAENRLLKRASSRYKSKDPGAE